MKKRKSSRRLSKRRKSRRKSSKRRISRRKSSKRRMSRRKSKRRMSRRKSRSRKRQVVGRFVDYSKVKTLGKKECEKKGFKYYKKNDFQGCFQKIPNIIIVDKKEDKITIATTLEHGLIFQIQKIKSKVSKLPIRVQYVIATSPLKNFIEVGYILSSVNGEKKYNKEKIDKDVRNNKFNVYVFEKPKKSVKNKEEMLERQLQIAEDELLQAKLAETAAAVKKAAEAKAKKTAAEAAEKKRKTSAVVAERKQPKIKNVYRVGGSRTFAELETIFENKPLTYWAYLSNSSMLWHIHVGTILNKIWKAEGSYSTYGIIDFNLQKKLHERKKVNITYETFNSKIAKWKQKWKFLEKIKDDIEKSECSKLPVIQREENYYRMRGLSRDKTKRKREKENISKKILDLDFKNNKCFPDIPKELLPLTVFACADNRVEFRKGIFCKESRKILIRKTINEFDEKDRKKLWEDEIWEDEKRLHRLEAQTYWKYVSEYYNTYMKNNFEKIGKEKLLFKFKHILKAPENYEDDNFPVELYKFKVRHKKNKKEYFIYGFKYSFRGHGPFYTIALVTPTIHKRSNLMLSLAVLNCQFPLGLYTCKPFEYYHQIMCRMDEEGYEYCGVQDQYVHIAKYISGFFPWKRST